MLSDDEIIALVVHHRVRVATGLASVDSAGADLMRELCGMDVAKVDLSADLRCSCPSGDGSLRWPCTAHPSATPPGVIGN